MLYLRVLVASLIFLAISAWAAAEPGSRPVIRSIRSIPQQTEAPEFNRYRHHERELPPDYVAAATVAESRIPQHSDVQDQPVHAAASSAPPAVSYTIAGNPYDNFTPPDPIVSVGPQHFLTVVNTSVAIYRKSDHHRLFITNFRNWFASLNWTGVRFYFDPKVLYDQYSGHYLLLCLAGTAKRSWLLFSASRTPDPMGDWGFWALDMQMNNATRAADIFADFPGLGIDRQAIYITANMWGGDDTYRYAKLRILKKSRVYAFSELPWRDFINLKEVTGQKAINVQPVHSFGSPGVEYLVETNAVRGNRITLFALHNPASGSPTLTRKGIAVSAYDAPPGALQKGGAAPLINAGDSGPLNAVFRNGTIFMAHSISHDWGSGAVSAIRYYQFRPSGTVDQEITYGKDHLHYFYPAVMPDSRGNVALAFNRCGTTEFAGFLLTGRRVSDPKGTLMNSIRLHGGLAHYNGDDPGSGLALWGDYNGVAVDSNDVFWAFGEFSKSLSQWGTSVSRFAF